ncbi:unnamed protein product [Rotaria sp. Silwood2]|nr:unnamed protein product [Rotaria sp. Silwood2]
MDGISHCYDAFDESNVSNSCSLNDTYRFRCTSENQCLSPTMVHNNQDNCIGGEDESKRQERITDIQWLPFSALCNGATEIVSLTKTKPVKLIVNIGHVLINIHAVMEYEINCSLQFTCPSDHHPCWLPNIKKMGCLHVNRTEDGIIDCLGATDERTFCRLSYPTEGFRHYQCWNNTKCTIYTMRCVECEGLYYVDEICRNPSQDLEKAIHYFRFMENRHLLQKLPFSPQSSRPFPTKILISSSSDNKTVQHQILRIKESKNINTMDSEQIWFCYRVISIVYGKNESIRCLYPPVYYGDRCQYQNQRVSLTVRVRNENAERLDIISSHCQIN